MSRAELATRPVGKRRRPAGSVHNREAFMRTVFCTSKRGILGGIALAALLTMPMACATTDDGGNPPGTESETTDELSTSFLFSCDSGDASTALDTSTMR